MRMTSTRYTYVLAVAILIFAAVLFGAFSLALPSDENSVIALLPAVAYAWDGDAGSGCCGGVNEVDGVDNDTGSEGQSDDDDYNPPKKHYPKPSCDIDSYPSYIFEGDSSTLTWSSNNAYAATLSGFGSVSRDGSREVFPDNTKTYTLTVTGSGGTATCATTIVVKEQKQAPTCTLSVSPSSIDEGESATLSWDSTNATSATLNHGIGSVAVDGSRSVSPSSSRTYVLTVSGSGGTADCSAPITVREEEKTPTCSMYASPTSIDEGDGSTLSWSSTNADSASLSQGIGSIGVNGSYTVYPSMTRTYILTVSGYGKTDTCSATVYVEQQQEEIPSCWLDISPSSIEKGESTSMSWGSDNATSAKIDGFGYVALDGSRTIYPNYSRSYTMTVENSDGETRTCDAYVDVEKHIVPPPPSNELFCTINASPNYIQSGASSVLSWQTYGNVSSAWLSGGLGPVSQSGSLFIRPKQSQNYTLTISDGYGRTRTCSTNVNVRRQVLPVVTASYVAISQVPYTGLGDSFSGTMLWLGLAVLAIASFFTLAWYRKRFTLAFRSVILR
jgi:hypothetical protein